MTSKQILTTENQTESVAMTLERLVQSSIITAVAGGMLNPQEGVDYLPDEPQDITTFDAHTWVKNAVLLGVMAGAELAGRVPRFAPDAETVNSTATAVMIGGNAFGRMQSIAREG